MAGWNGSGIFTRTYNWVQDAANGIKIRADRHDVNDTDFVNGINNCITKDGQNSATANLPMGNNKHTNVANGTSRNEYLAVGQFQDNNTKYYATTGSSNAYIVTANPAISSYVAGQSFLIKPNFANTGASTININGVGAVALTKEGTTALVSGDLETDKIYNIIYDGAGFQIEYVRIQNPSFTDITCNTLAATTDVTCNTLAATTDIETPLITDNNGDEILAFSAVPSPTTYYEIIAGGRPTLEAKGSDANISCQFQIKGNAFYVMQGSASTAAKIRLQENTTNGTGYVQLNSPESITSSYEITLPGAAGSNGDILQTDGSGNLSFIPTNDIVGVTQYSGSVVYNTGATGGIYNNLDLSGTVGTNRALIFLSVETDSDNTIKFRTNGETKDIAPDVGGAYGSGVSAASINGGTIVYLTAITDSSGIVEFEVDSSAVLTITLLTYTAL